MTKFNFDVFNSEKLADEGARLHLKHPATGERVYIDDEQKKPITITLKGSDCKEYTSYIESRMKSNRKLAAKGKEEDIDLDREVRASADLYAKMTLGWENISHEEKPLEFNYKNAVMLYMTYKEIRTQAADFIAAKENFIKG